jgi:hypothetical protein
VLTGGFRHGMTRERALSRFSLSLSRFYAARQVSSGIRLGLSQETQQCHDITTVSRRYLDGISTVSRCTVIPLYHSMPLSSSGIHSSPSSCSAEFQARPCASRVSVSMRSPMRVCVRAQGCRIRRYLMHPRMVRQGANQTDTWHMPKAVRESDDDVFYLFLQKQKIALGHIPFAYSPPGIKRHM